VTPILRPAHPNGYGSSRGGFAVDTIVLHTTESTTTSALGWFASKDAHVSAHFVVAPDGKVYECVPVGFPAWHAGNYGVNLASVGIECVGHCAEPDMWTPALVESLVSTIVDLCQQFPKIVPDRNHIIGHAEVPDPTRAGHFGGKGGHTDPGVLINWEYIIGETQRRLAIHAAPTEGV
jgi:N-acetyl-anhydromuramyl-L-alanine amidase AmpD